MKGTSFSLSRRLLLAALVIGAALAGAGCASVAPWEKGLLADPAMQFSSEHKGAVYEQHVLNAREASSGGVGGVGGGCGCK